MANSIIEQKSFDFAVRIIRLCKYLRSSGCERELISQLLRSGTSIGANIAEAERSQSKKDFISKMYISYKETNETIYWIKLLHASNYLSKTEIESILPDCIEIQKLLTSILKTSNEKQIIK